MKYECLIYTSRSTVSYVSHDLILKQTRRSSSKEAMCQPESTGAVCSQCVHHNFWRQICSHPPNPAGEDGHCGSFKRHGSYLVHYVQLYIWDGPTTQIVRKSWETKDSLILQHLSLSLLRFVKSHDCFSFLLHHRRREVLRRFFLLYVELLSRGRDGVLRDRAVLHVSREVPVAVEGDGPQAGGEVQGQRAPGGHVSDAGVRHHGSIAIRVTATPGFSLEVQSERPPTPWLLDFCLDLKSDKNENKTRSNWSHVIWIVSSETNI